jgi:hypothetical protein
MLMAASNAVIFLFVPKPSTTAHWSDAVENLNALTSMDASSALISPRAGTLNGQIVRWPRAVKVETKRFVALKATAEEYALTYPTVWTTV